MLGSYVPEQAFDPSTTAAPQPSAQSPGLGMLSLQLTWGSLHSCSPTLGCLQAPTLVREACLPSGGL